MKKSRFAVEQIVFALKQAELGRRYRASAATRIFQMPRFTLDAKVRRDFSFRTHAHAAAQGG